MGFFSRKSSKPSAQSERLSINTNGSQMSGSSLAKSPVFSRNGNGLATPVSSTNMSEAELVVPKAADPTIDPAGYLKSLHSVRERSRLIFQKALKNQLVHFDVDLDKFADTATYVVSIIKRDFAPDFASIPLHGKGQHFDVGGRPRVEQLLASWPSTVDGPERTRRLLDLFTVSVLLDASAGARWQYKSKQSGKTYRRSEGLAVATLEMFTAGAFSSLNDQPCRVDASSLKRMTVDKLAKGLQTSETNSIQGLEGRAALLTRLGRALENQQFFGTSSRPGNMLDYLLNHPATQMNSVPVVPVTTLWTLLMDGLAPIWTTCKTQVSGATFGDVWPCSTMPSSPPAQQWESIMPLHKQTQWLTFSLMAPMARVLRIRFAGVGLLTALPDSRNGGLLIDTGLLTLKPHDMRRGIEAYNANAKHEGQPNVEVVPLFNIADDVVVEWRAVTIGFLDELLVEVNKRLALTDESALNLAQLLEAGSWKGGRELAEVSRPNTKEAPIMVLSDGALL